jgi:secondary thiamine-phosphate synthase enzyme
LHRLSVRTTTNIQFINLTTEIQNIVTGSKITSGICVIFVPHTTAGITLNENADPAVLTDLKKEFLRLAPARADFEHNEGNSPAHLAAGLTGHSVTIIVEGGRLVLGTWQAIYLAEFDGPRLRDVLVKISPD